MKFVSITGGLGNQMFIYAFYEELKVRGHKAVLFVPHRTHSKKYGHQGYELDKLFPVISQSRKESSFSASVLMLYSQILRIFPLRFRMKLYRLIGINVVTFQENFIFYPEVFASENKHELFRGTWQSEKYFEHAGVNIRNAFVFNQLLLNDASRLLANEIENKVSVSIHIRRGDYLSPQYLNGFGGICTPEYYKKAIQHIRENTDNPFFYIFTDDPEWVNKNFVTDNATYVKHNKGVDSWQDMYLMSRCKHNIIANSSFSWWGAWLNSNPDKIVVAPKKWWSMFGNDDVVPENWIRL